MRIIFGKHIGNLDMGYKLLLVVIAAVLSGCTGKFNKENDNSVSLRYGSVFYIKDEPHRTYLELKRDDIDFEQCIVNVTKKIVNLNTLKTSRVYKSVYILLGDKKKCSFKYVLLSEWQLTEINPEISINNIKRYESELSELFKVSKQLFSNNNPELEHTYNLQNISTLGPLNHIAYINELSDDSINFIILLGGVRYGATIDNKNEESVLKLHPIIH